MVKDTRKQLGTAGEDLASAFLEQNGFRILERNHRTRHGEIDIIAINEEYLVFCEVKTRKGNSQFHPSLSVTPAKTQRIRKLASVFLGRHGYTRHQPRFDVISIQFLPQRKPLIEHIANAF